MERYEQMSDSIPLAAWLRVDCRKAGEQQGGQSGSNCSTTEMSSSGWGSSSGGGEKWSDFQSGSRADRIFEVGVKW